jgi:Ca-activated chloride channel homolog
MKKLSVLTALILTLSLTGLAQSGRRLKTAPTPAPTPAAEREAAKEYSESSSGGTRTIAPNTSNERKSDRQKTPVPPVVTPKPDETVSSSDEDEVLKVETNLISIPVSVYERSGIYVGDLGQSDFKIFEDGKEQEIAYFGTSDQPFSVILLIDTSPSTSFKIEEIQAAAIAFVDQLKPADKVMVISFSLGVNVLTDFTTDRQKIYKAIRRTNFGDGTSLYEAVSSSLRRQLKKIEGRKAVVLFTDGVDTTSRGSGYNSTLEDAEESEAVIFPIYYNTFLENRGIGGGGVMSTPPILGLPGGGGGAPSSADYARGRVYLESLAQATGGKMFRSESTPGGLSAAFEGIAKELRSQYSIGYYPAETGQPGQRKQIKVRVARPNLAVRARDSYIVGAAEAAKTKNSKTQ